MLLSVTGCGNNYLNLHDGRSSDLQEWNVSFENDIATKMTSITKIEVNDEYEEQLDQIEESFTTNRGNEGIFRKRWKHSYHD